MGKGNEKRKGDAPPQIAGTVTVFLMEGGAVSVQAGGGLSQIAALGLLAAGQHVILAGQQKAQRIIPPAAADLKAVKGGKE